MGMRHQFQWMDKSSWILACYYIFKKAKSYFKNYWVDMVKYGCVLLGHRTLKSAIPQPENKLMNWADFLHAESDGIIFG